MELHESIKQRGEILAFSPRLPAPTTKEKQAIALNGLSRIQGRKKPNISELLVPSHNRMFYQLRENQQAHLDENVCCALQACNKSLLATPRSAFSSRRAKNARQQNSTFVSSPLSIFVLFS